MTKCFDCRQVKHRVRTTGSFLCNECLDKMIDRFSKYRGIDQNIQLERAKQMMKQTDLSVAEIARRTGNKVAVLYYHRRKMREGA